MAREVVYQILVDHGTPPSTYYYLDKVEADAHWQRLCEGLASATRQEIPVPRTAREFVLFLEQLDR